ncbi:Non-specific serine/threonine protein kinase [Bertholletia excelsa]
MQSLFKKVQVSHKLATWSLALLGLCQSSIDLLGKNDPDKTYKPSFLKVRKDLAAAQQQPSPSSTCHTKIKSSSNFIGLYCPNTTTYTSGGAYSANLKTLLFSLASNASSPTGYFNSTAGRGSLDTVYGLFLCRGDVSTSVCEDCVVGASKEVVMNCPKGKTAAIYYDGCWLGYSSLYNFFSQNNIIPLALINTQIYDTQNVTDANWFRLSLLRLMQDLAGQAANDISGKKFAAGEVKLNANNSLYGLQQCTPDLSTENCNTCLQEAVSELTECCDQRRGARVILLSCSIRYELYQFYNVSAIKAQPPPPDRASKSGSDRKKKTIIGISASEEKRAKNIQEARLLQLSMERFPHDYSSDNIQGDDTNSQDFPSIKLDLIRKATNHFSTENKLGEGGFGPVYKGTLPNGKEIAVKRLSRSSGQGLQELKNEITLIARLQHRNLVRLLGCCLEEKESMLIYEYMPNRSLDVYIFDPIGGTNLNWKTRLSIINGIARGILYLHEDSRLRIIHRDLKASNILLDHEMNPKISDFGMARIFCENQSEANTNRVVGTYGYMAPEYAMEGLFSIKSDIFSFGNNGFYLSEHGESLLTFAWKLWIEGKGSKLIDPSLEQSCVVTEALKCIHIALLCVQQDPADRPTMSFVVAMLATEGMTFPQPKQPPFSVGRLMLASTQSSEKVKMESINEVTLTDAFPR